MAKHASTTTVKLPRVPVAYMVTGAILVALVAGLLAMLATATAPTAKADTGYLSPAVTAARVASFTSHLTTADSSGLGINPAAIAVPATGPAWMARVKAASVDHGTPWQRVLMHCKHVKCFKHIPAAMARDAGIKHGQAYRVHYGDTTYIWVRLAHNRVRTIVS